MATRRPLFEENTKRLGGQVTKANQGKVNIIYPDSWLDHPVKRKKTK